MRNELTGLLFAMGVLVVFVSSTAVAQEVVQGAGTSIEEVNERVSPLQSLNGQTQNADEADLASNRRSTASASKWGPERNPDVSRNSGKAASNFTSGSVIAGSPLNLHTTEKLGDTDLTGHETAEVQLSSGVGRPAAAHKQTAAAKGGQNESSSPFKHSRSLHGLQHSHLEKRLRPAATAPTRRSGKSENNRSPLATHRRHSRGWTPASREAALRIDSKAKLPKL